MALPFKTVRERLLCSGIAPRHVNRYITELREHLADLTQRERATGADPKQASALALTLMGSDELLVRAMVERGCPRSLAARAPWAILTLLPVILLVVILALTGMTMFHLLWPMQGMTPQQMSEGYQALIAGASVVTQYLLGPVVVAACIAVALRQRLTTPWLWVGIGLVALISGLFGFHAHVQPAAGGHAAATAYSLAGIVYVDGRPSAAASLGVAVLRALVLFCVALTAYRMMRTRLAMQD